MTEALFWSAAPAFIRSASLLAAAPFFSIAAVPRLLRPALALLLALAVLPALGPSVPPDTAATLAMVVRESIIGLVLGLSVTVVMAGATLAGEVAGVQMGLGAAEALDPSTNAATPVVGNLLYLFMLAIWLATNGHLHLIEALGASFRLLPPGTPLNWAAALPPLAGLLTFTFETAVRIAAPVLVAMLAANVAMSVLARTAQGMNVFIASFPVTISLGLLTLATAVGLLADRMGGWLHAALMDGGWILRLLATP